MLPRHLLSFVCVCQFFWLEAAFEINIEQTPAMPCFDDPIRQDSAKECEEVVETAGKDLVWTFHHRSGECEPYPSDGCRFQTKNQFPNFQNCKLTCALSACLLGPKAINCQSKAPLWFFNPLNGTCLQYPPDTCPFTANGFESEAACYSSCARAICTLGLEPGRCGDAPGRGSFQRWFFNSTSGKCQRFLFRDCPIQSGNLNNFISEKECNVLCQCTQENGCLTSHRALVDAEIDQLDQMTVEQSYTPDFPLRKESFAVSEEKDEETEDNEKELKGKLETTMTSETPVPRTQTKSQTESSRRAGWTSALSATTVSSRTDHFRATKKAESAVDGGIYDEDGMRPVSASASLLLFFPFYFVLLFIVCKS